MPSQHHAPFTVCEYGTVDAFLTALSQPGAAEVYLAPVRHTLGVSSAEAGALLTGQRPDESARVHLCLVLAAEVVLDGARGRITYPYHQAQEDRQARQHVRDLQLQLLSVLKPALQQDPRVTHLRYPAFLHFPDIRVWNKDALVGFPVSYLDGRWLATPRA